MKPFLLGLFLLLPSCLFGAMFTYHEIGDADDEFRATALNDRGWITGNSRFPRLARLYQPGVGIKQISEESMGIWDVNNAGTVSGVFNFGSGFFRTFNGPFTSLDMEDARALNEKGQVVGSRASRAVIYTPGEGTIELGTLGGDASWGLAINERGQVAGGSTLPDGTRHGFLYTPGEGMIDIGILPGFSDTIYVTGINDLGQVVGYTDLVFFGEDLLYPGRAFLYTPGNGMRNLGLEGTFYTQPTAINNSGWIVGTSSSGGAFLYRPGHGIVPLAELVDDLNGRPRRLIQAIDINERGDIVGTSREGGRDTTFLLTLNTTAIPEPAPFTTLGIGFASMCVVRLMRSR